MRWIDPKQGPRAGLYRHFRTFARPQYTLCARVDLRPLKARNDLGLFPMILKEVILAANAVPELRQRIRVVDGEERIVEHDRVDCTCTIGRDDGTFTFGHFPYPEEDFAQQVRERAESARQTEGLGLEQEGRDDKLFITCLPWLDFTTMQHAEIGDPLDCVPRIAWGRVVDEHVTVCLTANHCLVDGIHVARFFQALE